MCSRQQLKKFTNLILMISYSLSKHNDAVVYSVTNAGFSSDFSVTDKTPLSEVNHESFEERLISELDIRLLLFFYMQVKSIMFTLIFCKQIVTLHNLYKVHFCIYST